MGHATVNVQYPLRMLLGDGSQVMYPTVAIYNSSDTLVSSASLTHIAAGMYGASVVLSTPGIYHAIYIAYSDSGHTTLANYDREGDEIEVTATLPNQILESLLADHLTADTVGEAFSIMRGLLQQNFVLDQPVFNSDGLLTSSRVRIFPTAADATAGTNAIATYAQTAVAGVDASLPASYKMVRT